VGHGLGLVGWCSYLSHFLQSGKPSSSFHGYDVNALLQCDGITIIVSLFIKLVNSSTLIPHFVILRLLLLSWWLQWVFLKYLDMVGGLVSGELVEFRCNTSTVLTDDLAADVGQAGSIKVADAALLKAKPLCAEAGGGDFAVGQVDRQ